MQKRIILLCCGLGFFSGLLVFFGSQAQPVWAESSHQDTVCGAVLVDAASRAGAVTDEVEWLYDQSDPWSCYVRYTSYDGDARIEVEFRIETNDFDGDPSYSYNCYEDKFCHPTTFHGHPAVLQEATSLEFFWYVNPTGGMGYVLAVSKGRYSGVETSEVMALAEALWSTAEPALPWSDDYSQPNPEDQPETIPSNPENPSDGDVLDPSGEQADGGFPISGNQRKSLGPLATTPLIPLAGGLIGTVVGWLVSVVATSGNRFKTVVPSSARPVYPKPAVVPFTKTPTQSTQQPISPPSMPTESLPISANPPPLEPATPPAVPIAEKPGPLELGFNLVKDTVSAIGNVSGVFNKYLAGPDTAETINVIRNAVKTWHDAPSIPSATNYLESLQKSNALREPEISKTLGVVGKGLDVVEAVVKARVICQERGYSGWDALLTTYANVGEKAVVWGLTKNPVVALADAAVGGATQLAFGAKNKIDLGAAVDKSAEAWDNVTRHAADRYYRGIEKDADNERIENLRFLTERIRQQVVDGKISPQEGSHRLQNVIDKTNRESPLL